MSLAKYLAECRHETIRDIVSYGGDVIARQCAGCFQATPFGPCPRCGEPMINPHDHCREPCFCKDGRKPIGAPYCEKCTPVEVRCAGCDRMFTTTVSKATGKPKFHSSFCRKIHKERETQQPQLNT